MRMITAVALCLIVCLFPADQVEAFAVQPQQMQPMLDQAFKVPQPQAIEAASRRVAKEAGTRAKRKICPDVANRDVLGSGTLCRVFVHEKAEKLDRKRASENHSRFILPWCLTRSDAQRSPASDRFRAHC